MGSGGESTRGAGWTSAPGELIELGHDELRFERDAMVGRYVILDRIGEGGMSIVYVARDPELDRKVAIKVMRQRSPADGAASRRLLREAHALARVIHPKVIPVQDVGTVQGLVFLVEGYIDGSS